MRECAGARVELRHHVRAPTEGAKRHAAADVLAQRREVGPDAQPVRQTMRPQPRRHHLVEDQQRPDPRGPVAQCLQEVAPPRNAAARALHRLDQDGGDVRAVRVDLHARRIGVVVRQHEEVEGHGRRRRLVAKAEHAPVVAAREHDDLSPPRETQRGRQRHQVRLGARVGEAQLLDLRKALADRLREPAFEQVVAREVDAALHRLDDRLADLGRRVAVDAGRVLGDEVGVAMAVRVPERRALAFGDGERERCIEQHRAAVGAGHVARLCLEAAQALRIAVGETLMGLGQGLVDGGRHGRHPLGMERTGNARPA
ncbi:hypothetical protein FQZ97_668170 [compost metagenome]